MNDDLSPIIESVCQQIESGNLADAARIISAEYPFHPVQRSTRQTSLPTVTRIFLRDGFIDRYRGTRLIFPPVLRLISHYFPGEFPYHKNSKMSEGHMAYWELFPTVDHILPVARGGLDREENLVCCSMLTNSIKSNWTLEQLQWQLYPPGHVQEWDGMLQWFIRYVQTEPKLLTIPYIKRWHTAALSTIPNLMST